MKNESLKKNQEEVPAERLFHQGIGLINKGEITEGLLKLQEYVRVKKQSLADDTENGDIELAHALYTCAMFMLDHGEEQHAQKRAMLQEALGIYKRLLPGSVVLADTLLALALMDSQIWSEVPALRRAMVLYQEALPLKQRCIGPDAEKEVICILECLAWICTKLGDPVIAYDYYVQAMSHSEIIFGKSHDKTLRIKQDLLKILRFHDCQRYAEVAEELLTTSVYKTEIEVAARWWCQQLQTTSKHKVDPKDPSMSNSVNDLANQFAVEKFSIELTQVQTDTFVKALQWAIVSKMPPKLYLPFEVGVDYGPDDMLADALGTAGIPNILGMFPLKAHVTIYPDGNVVAVGGYGVVGEKLFTRTTCLLML